MNQVNEIFDAVAPAVLMIAASLYFLVNGFEGGMRLYVRWLLSYPARARKKTHKATMDKMKQLLGPCKNPEEVVEAMAAEINSKIDGNQKSEAVESVFALNPHKNGAIPDFEFENFDPKIDYENFQAWNEKLKAKFMGLYQLQVEEVEKKKREERARQNGTLHQATNGDKSS